MQLRQICLFYSLIQQAFFDRVSLLEFSLIYRCVQCVIMLFIHIMKPIVKVEKQIWQVMSSVKDTVGANLVRASSSRALELNRDQLQVVLQLVNASIDEALQKGINQIKLSVTKAIEEEKEAIESKYEHDVVVD
jgi:ferritin-like metal-binding protein YciE